MTTIYVARPIDLSVLTEEQAENYLFVVKTLTDYGCVVYEPGKAFTVSPGTSPHGSIQEINRHALRVSDALVAFYPEMPGVGVAMELEQARAAGQPILVVTEVAKRSWSLAGIVGAEVTQFPDQTAVTRLMEAAALRKLNGLGGAQPLRFQLDDGAVLPTRGYPGDAGYDLYVQEDAWIGPGEFVDVACGCAVQLPDHLWGMITGRSSTLRKHNLLVATGIIDTGYRGPLFAGVKNLGDEPFEAKRGMRLAQLIPLPNAAENLRATEVQVLDPSERGTAGFGSSGE
jgi:dUTP pyrophosphatase